MKFRLREWSVGPVSVSVYTSTYPPAAGYRVSLFGWVASASVKHAAARKHSAIHDY